MQPLLDSLAQEFCLFCLFVTEGGLLCSERARAFESVCEFFLSVLATT